MSIIKDYKEDVAGYRFRHKVKETIDPRTWLRLHKWRKQRADRGYSNQDTWNAGDHIAKLTAEMLQHLLDNGLCDWPEWFRLNVKEEGKGAYKNLQQVINDINSFLEFEWTTWGEELEPREIERIQHKDGVEIKTEWVYPNGKVATEADIKHRINVWHKEYDKRYKKAGKAMGFFGRHFSSFWD